MMRRAALLALSLLATINSNVFGADAGPGKMQHIAVKICEPAKLAQPGLDRARDYYIVSNKLAKMEEAPNADARHQMTVIVKDPDFWEIEAKSKKAIHITEAHRDGHFAIFENGPNAEASDVVSKLSFGNELDFFKSHNAKKTSGKFEGQTVDEYSVPVKEVTLILDTDPKSGTPKRVALKMKDAQLALKYVKYEIVPTNDKTFAIPSGVEMKTMTAVALEQRKIEIRKQVVNRLEAMRQQTLKQIESDQKTEKALQDKSKTGTAKPAAK